MAINIDIGSIAKSADGIRYSAYRSGNAPVGGTVLFEDALDGAFDASWNLVDAGSWSAQTGFARCSYAGAGTSGYQLKHSSINGLREVYISFDMRQSITTVGPKMLKLFGQQSAGNYSNATFGAVTGYVGKIDGMSYGNAATGANDNARDVRTDGVVNDTRSTGITVPTSQASLIASSAAFRRFQWHYKQNTDSVTADGEIQLYIDSVLQLDVQNMFNRGDDSLPLDYLSFGDYTSSATTFDFDVRNVVISTGGWKAGDAP